jgi:uncharacterized protein
VIPVIERVRNRVRGDFAAADAAHDMSHLDRVADLCAAIASDLGTDPGPAQAAAYVHDYHRLLESRQGLRPVPPEAAESEILAVLHACDVPSAWHAVILGAVELTGRYGFGGDRLVADPTSVAAIVHDADNLDAIGTVGIARAFAFGGLLGEPLWDPEAEMKQVYSEGRTSSVLGHLYEKLVRLERDMLTEPGRRIALDRTRELHRFAGRFRTEWAGIAAPGPDTAPAARWDPVTRYLTATNTGADDKQESSHLSFRCPVRLALDERDRPQAVELLDPLLVLVSCAEEWQDKEPAEGGRASVVGWRVTAHKTGIVFVLTAGAPRRTLEAIADVEVSFAPQAPTALRLHLVRTVAEQEDAHGSGAASP